MSNFKVGSGYGSRDADTLEEAIKSATRRAINADGKVIVYQAVKTVEFDGVATASMVNVTDYVPGTEDADDD